MARTTLDAPEDQLHASGDVGTMALAVRNSALAALTGADGRYSPLAADANGRLIVAPAVAIAASDGASNSLGYAPDGAGGARILPAAGFGYNGATWDRARNNAEGTALASAARTAGTAGIDVVTYNARGIALLLEVTANPGGAETLSLKLQVKLPSGTYADLADAGVLFTAANGAKGLIVYPGVLAADHAAGMVGKSAAITGRTVRPYVTHSAAGSWTYRLDTVLLV